MSWLSPLEAVADDRVADRQGEETEANGQHDEVQHRVLLGGAVRLIRRGPDSRWNKTVEYAVLPVWFHSNVGEMPLTV
jgi:hypothetical protein